MKSDAINEPLTHSKIVGGKRINKRLSRHTYGLIPVCREDCGVSKRGAVASPVAQREYRQVRDPVGTQKSVRPFDRVGLDCYDVLLHP